MCVLSLHTHSHLLSTLFHPHTCLPPPPCTFAHTHTWLAHVCILYREMQELDADRQQKTKRLFSLLSESQAEANENKRLKAKLKNKKQ